jgi:hypothetical protein
LLPIDGCGKGISPGSSQSGAPDRINLPGRVKAPTRFSLICRSTHCSM